LVFDFFPQVLSPIVPHSPPFSFKPRTRRQGRVPFFPISTIPHLFPFRFHLPSLPFPPLLLLFLPDSEVSKRVGCLFSFSIKQRGWYCRLPPPPLTLAPPSALSFLDPSTGVRDRLLPVGETCIFTFCSCLLPPTQYVRQIFFILDQARNPGRSLFDIRVIVPPVLLFSLFFASECFSPADNL